MKRTNREILALPAGPILDQALALALGWEEVSNAGLSTLSSVHAAQVELNRRAGNFNGARTQFYVGEEGETRRRVSMRRWEYWSPSTQESEAFELYREAAERHLWPMLQPIGNPNLDLRAAGIWWECQVHVARGRHAPQLIASSPSLALAISRAVLLGLSQQAAAQALS